jgi:mycofactocin precursor
MIHRPQHEEEDMTLADTARDRAPDNAGPTPPPQDTGRSDGPPAAEAADRALVEADLLVEDVSIDGMCGVY